jgi:hypothetical protein
MKRRDKQLMKWIGAPVCAGLIGLQFLRRTIPNPPVTAEIQAPAEVRQILRNSCYNCHSNETKLSWYDKVMPIGWLVAKDVRNARRHVNFSEIGDLPADQQTVILYEAVNKIQLGAMPLPSYRAIHPQATITATQLAVLRAFLIASNPSRSDASTLHDSLSSQSTARIRPKHDISVVRPAPNGIAFIPEYKNWRAISTTDRFDNDTIRVVLGNDVAIKAIADHHIDPWPDGTIMAKVVWSQRLDESGIAHAGSLQHIALMIRDSKKYAATENWGFAWWNGDELEPKGKDASFSRECVACHTPLRKNDYVFTTPLARPR